MKRREANALQPTPPSTSDKMIYVAGRFGRRESVVSEDAIRRFWLKVHKTDGCWFWIGARTRNGYGQFAVSHNFNVGTHRFAWLISAGSLPLAPLEVLHRCDVPACVRPDHLWLGTQSDNLSDAALKGRLPRSIEACA